MESAIDVTVRQRKYAIQTVNILEWVTIAKVTLGLHLVRLLGGKNDFVASTKCL